MQNSNREQSVNKISISQSHTGVEQEAEQQVPDSIHHLGYSGTGVCNSCNLIDDKWCVIKHHYKGKGMEEGI